MWFGGNAFHNQVITRNASFVRFLPKLVLKFARIPAMFGGLAIGAFAWVQYQATRTLSLERRVDTSSMAVAYCFV